MNDWHTCILGDDDDDDNQQATSVRTLHSPPSMKPLPDFPFEPSRRGPSLILFLIILVIIFSKYNNSKALMSQAGGQVALLSF